ADPGSRGFSGGARLCCEKRRIGPCVTTSPRSSSNSQASSTTALARDPLDELLKQLRIRRPQQERHGEKVVNENLVRCSATSSEKSADPGTRCTRRSRRGYAPTARSSSMCAITPGDRESGVPGHVCRGLAPGSLPVVSVGRGPLVSAALRRSARRNPQTH